MDTPSLYGPALVRQSLVDVVAQVSPICVSRTGGDAHGNARSWRRTGRRSGLLDSAGDVARGADGDAFGWSGQLAREARADLVLRAGGRADTSAPKGVPSSVAVAESALCQLASSLT